MNVERTSQIMKGFKIYWLVQKLWSGWRDSMVKNQIFNVSKFKPNECICICIYTKVKYSALKDTWIVTRKKSTLQPRNRNIYIGGISQDVKRLKIWDFYPLFFGFSLPSTFFLLWWKLLCVWSNQKQGILCHGLADTKARLSFFYYYFFYQKHLHFK